MGYARGMSRARKRSSGLRKGLRREWGLHGVSWVARGCLGLKGIASGKECIWGLLEVSLPRTNVVYLWQKARVSLYGFKLESGPCMGHAWGIEALARDFGFTGSLHVSSRGVGRVRG